MLQQLDQEGYTAVMRPVLETEHFRSLTLVKFSLR